MKGICFIEPMFHAVVNGQKTQTRRLVKSSTDFFNVESNKDGVITDIWKCDADGSSGGNLISVNPKYKLGEVIYLKEPYKFTHIDNIWFVNYKFDGCKIECPISSGHNELEKLLIQQEKSKSGFLNKLFMPEWAARYFIEITAVRAERLQDISEEDCMREGIEKRMFNGKVINIPEYYNGYDSFDYPKEAYADLIDSINGKGTWESNPFVWVYDFKPVKI